jgi:P pilus assembly chaperone PapD
MKKIILLATIFFLMPFRSEAVSVSPIPIVIESKSATVNIANSEKKYQAEIFLWTQGGGEEALIETADIVAYPLIFKAPQDIKVATRKEKQEIEQAYRLIISEIPEKKEGIQTVLSLSIPVFITPKGKEVRKVEVECMAGEIIVKNTGNVHAKITHIDGEPAVQYVLPATQRKFTANSILIEKIGEFCKKN